MTQDSNKTKAQLIAELKRTRKELDKIETVSERPQSKDAKFRLLTENSVTGIFIIQDAKMVYVNPSMARMLGYEPEEIVGKLTLKELVHPDDIQVAVQRMQERLGGIIEERNIAYKAVKKDGSLVYIEVYGVRTEFQGKPAVMGTLIDVTRRKKAEEALLESEGKFRSITETAVDYIFIKDETRKYTFVNKAMIDLLGLPENEILGKTPEEIFGADEGGIIKDVDDRTFAGDTVNETRNLFIGKNQRSFNTVQTPLTMAGGKVNSIMGIVRDITERKMAEDALRENEMLFSSLLQHSPIYVFFKDRNMRSLRLSANYEQMLGMPVTEALGKSMEELFPSDLAHNMVADDRRILEKGKMVQVQETLNDRHYETIKFPILKDGEPDMLAGFTVDITERKQTEEALQEALKFKEKLISEVPVGISIYDADSGQCLAGNKAIAELIGATEEQVLAQNFYTIESWKKSGLLETAKSALKVNAKKELDVDVTTTFGKEICFHCYFVPFMAGDKRYLLFTLNDLTERRQMEKQLQQSEKMQAIGQLAGGIAHDFNNQLAGIVGYADMLREELSNSPELSHYADNILLSTKRASDLTSQLLAFARKGKYLSVSVDIHKIISEVVDMLKRTIHKRIVIRQHLDAQKAQIQGDPTQVQNAIMNIALNARDAMPDGGELKFATSIAHLDAEYCRTNPYDIKPGSFVKVSVTDNGTGMDEETQKKIFEPFYTTKGPGKGTGMGLASVYGTAKTHSGSIEVDSRPGHGTTMVLYLPLISSDTASEEEPEMRTDPGKGNAHILFVDDEEFVVDSASMTLERSGYQVSICRNGREAVIYYNENWKTIDLVIIDMVMPEMGGRETFAEMKKLNPQIKALLSSGYSINGEAQEILNEGVAGFIQKPYLRIELTEKVAGILKERTPEQE